MEAKIYDVSVSGWLKKCWVSIQHQETCDIHISGKDAAAIYAKLQRTVNSIPFTKINLPVLMWNGVPITPMYIALVLGTIGSIGGVCGSVATILGMAASHGMKISMEFNIDPFDNKEDEVIFHVISAKSMT